MTSAFFFSLSFQVIELLPPAVGIAVSLTTRTFMFLEVTTQTMTSQEAQRMKTIHCSGSFGGTTSPQAAGSRSEQRGTCPPSWRLCQVKHPYALSIWILNAAFKINVHFLDIQIWCSCLCAAVLHGNNLLVFGGTGIPFGENNGNDVHVCNVKYKRWSLLNCRGKKPNRIYGQVGTEISPTGFFFFFQCYKKSWFNI